MLVISSFDLSEKWPNDACWDSLRMWQMGQQNDDRWRIEGQGQMGKIMAGNSEEDQMTGFRQQQTMPNKKEQHSALLDHWWSDTEFSN